MTTLREGSLEMALPKVARARKFDDAASHGLTHCMKAVDFIIELPDRMLFIEFKDPDNLSASPGERAKFAKRLSGGQIDRDLVGKFRDSFLYEWAAGRLGKPAHYWVLIALSSLDEAMLLSRGEKLRRQLPLQGPSNGAWSRQISETCAVFSLATWNKHLPEYSVHRVAT